MKFHFLGTGTSVGVPLLGCDCKTCTSSEAKNKRYRASAFIDFDASGLEEGKHSDKQSDKQSELRRGLLIDTTPDLRSQMLRLGFRKLEAVFYTHSHADHTNGIDDLRAFNFAQGGQIPVYSDAFTAEELRAHFPYAFGNVSTIEGGFPPKLSSKLIKPFEKIEIGGVSVLPILVNHGKNQILGFRIGSLAYLTDCSGLPDESLPHLQNLEILVIGALRHRPHPNHLTVRQAIEEIEKLKPKTTYLTHISHELEHEESNKLLRELSPLNISLAYDGLSAEF